MRRALPLLALCLGCVPEAPPDPTLPPPVGDGTTADTAVEVEPRPDPGATRAVHDRELLPAALAALGAAEREIRVAMYVAYADEPVEDLLDALEDAAARGVAVRFLADEEGEETEGIVDRLALAGVEAKLDDPGVTLHNKLVVADDVAVVGSHNWTWSALEANHEGSALVADAEVAGWYASWFDAVWAEPGATPTAPAWSRADLVPLADRAVLDAVLGCVGGAEARVDVVMYALAWDAAYPGSEVDRILLALEAASARGVQVRVVVDGSDWILENAINDAAVARLRAAGIEVWRAPRWVTTHAKVLLCDATALVSDANWSYSGLALAHGTSLLATAPEVVAPTEAWMDGVRAESSPVP